MTALEYLHVIRRRWIFLVAGLLAGILGGVLTAPGESDDVVVFEGTHTLLVDADTPSAGTLNLEQAALLATTGPVPVRAEERIASEAVGTLIDVDAVASLELRSLTVRATASTPAAAALAADVFAEEIIAEYAGDDRQIFDQEIERATGDVAQLQEDLAEADLQLAALLPGDPRRTDIEQRRSSLADQLAAAEDTVDDLTQEGPPDPPLRTLEAAVGRPVGAEGWKLPEGPLPRAFLLGGLGLLLGAVGALVADRLDTRVRDLEDAQRAFDLPVIAEIPPLLGEDRTNRGMVVKSRPSSPFVESYRALRTVVLFAASESAAADSNDAAAAQTNRSGERSRDAQVVVVTSPSAGEGKTTTSAHLAALLAEAEQRVLVISADFRRPRIHEHFNMPRQPGLADVLAESTGHARLQDLNLRTEIDGLHLLASGNPADNPAPLLAECAHVIAAARRLFDFIVIDTPPLLVANDATELAREADHVILVARADRTPREAARRSTDTLRRVDAKILGVVLCGAHDTPSAYGYYRHRYYAEASRRDKGERHEAKAATPELSTGARVPVEVDDR